MTGTYFSKPDWSCPYYWWDQYATPDRRVNYDISRHPERWQQFQDYTSAQIHELMSQYGPVDILWLDGGWVRPDNLGQDIRLGEIVEEIRSTSQPHLIVSERTCGGEYENFITPEKTVPEDALSVPWETCTTVGKKFSFHYTDTFKSGHQLVLLLLDVVSKGGNLALNIAPQPDGELPAPAVRSLRDLGAWLKIFGDGIYGTRICAPYFGKNLFYTCKGDNTYAFFAYGDIPALPEQINLSSEKTVRKVTSMRTGASVRFRQEGSTVTIFPENVPMGGAFYAEGFCITAG